MLFGRGAKGDVTFGKDGPLNVDSPGNPLKVAGPGSLETLAGETGRSTCGTGEADRSVRTGEEGLAMRDIVEVAGLAGRGTPPDFPLGDSGRE